LTRSAEAPGGGKRSYNPNHQAMAFLSHTLLNRTVDSGNNFTGYVLTRAGGSHDYYQYVPTNQIDGVKIALLSAKVTASGHTSLFIYEVTNDVVFRAEGLYY
jgi:hypothetical protein